MKVSKTSLVLRATIVAVAVAVAGVVGCSAPEDLDAAEVTIDRAVTPRRYEDRTQCRVPGIVSSPKVLSLDSPASGRLAYAEGMAEGTQVRRGQIIAAVRGRDDAGQSAVVEAALRQANARLETQDAQMREATRKRDELRGLSDIVSRTSVEDAKDAVRRAQALRREAQAGVAIAEAELAQARARNELATMVAPFDGVVVALHADSGTSLNAGDRVALVRRSGARALRFAIDPDALAALSRGGVIEYRLADPGDATKRTAVITLVPTSADPRTALVIVIASDPTLETLAEGTSVEVLIPEHAAHWCTNDTSS